VTLETKMTLDESIQSKKEHLEERGLTGEDRNKVQKSLEKKLRQKASS